MIQARHRTKTGMTTTLETTATKRAPMDKTRRTALVAGVFYLITFVSIPTLALYGPVKNHRDWILSSGSHAGVLVGGFLTASKCTDKKTRSKS